PLPKGVGWGEGVPVFLETTEGSHVLPPKGEVAPFFPLPKGGGWGEGVPSFLEATEGVRLPGLTRWM
ncbi:MAG TPA: hypothetical protein VLS92_01640, partial [Acidimicrobiia bacterium]|nr:hypothetical protein [Acidimicrobiia bacterium]